MTALPPEAQTYLAGALATVRAHGAGRVVLAIDCDPAGKPSAYRVTAPGYDSGSRPIAPASPLAAAQGHAAEPVWVASRPEPCASLLAALEGIR
jgi:hypothetical protein